MVSNILNWGSYNKIDLILISRFIALCSFLIGTSIFLLFLLSKSFGLAYIGIIYVIIACIFNTAYLIGLIIKFFQKNTNRNQCLISILLVTLNIPIVLIYSYFLIYFI
jgi:hypothetical protein